MDVLAQLLGSLLVGAIFGAAQPAKREANLVTDRFPTGFVREVYGEAFSPWRTFLILPVVLPAVIVPFALFLLWLRAPERAEFPLQTLILVGVVGIFFGTTIRAKLVDKMFGKRT